MPWQIQLRHHFEHHLPNHTHTLATHTRTRTSTRTRAHAHAHAHANAKSKAYLIGERGNRRAEAERGQNQLRHHVDDRLSVRAPAIL